MPANAVKPGQEKLWQRAKKEAAKQGKSGNYALIMHIFQKMTGNKSMQPADGKEPTLIKLEVEKARKPIPGQLGLKLEEPKASSPQELRSQLRSGKVKPPQTQAMKQQAAGKKLEALGQKTKAAQQKGVQKVGERGGKITGYTSAGKAIYESKEKPAPKAVEEEHPEGARHGGHQEQHMLLHGRVDEMSYLRPEERAKLQAAHKTAGDSHGDARNAYKGKDEKAREKAKRKAHSGSVDALVDHHRVHSDYHGRKLLEAQEAGDEAGAQVHQQARDLHRNAEVKWRGVGHATGRDESPHDLDHHTDALGASQQAAKGTEQAHAPAPPEEPVVPPAIQAQQQVQQQQQPQKQQPMPGSTQGPAKRAAPPRQVQKPMAQPGAGTHLQFSVQEENDMSKSLGIKLEGEEELRKGLITEEDLKKGFYNRVTEWAEQFFNTPLYIQALQCLKDRTQCQKEREAAESKHKTWRELEEMPRTKRVATRERQNKEMDKHYKRRDEVQKRMSELEDKLLSHKMEEAKKGPMGKSVAVAPKAPTTAPSTAKVSSGTEPGAGAVKAEVNPDPIPVEKSGGGEGSKGGVVIGHDSKGNAIYAKHNQEHHASMVKHHKKMAAKHRKEAKAHQKEDRTSVKAEVLHGKADDHMYAAKQHGVAASLHERLGWAKERKEAGAEKFAGQVHDSSRDAHYSSAKAHGKSHGEAVKVCEAAHAEATAKKKEEPKQIESLKWSKTPEGEYTARGGKIKIKRAGGKKWELEHHGETHPITARKPSFDHAEGMVQHLDKKKAETKKSLVKNNLRIQLDAEEEMAKSVEAGEMVIGATDSIQQPKFSPFRKAAGGTIYQGELDNQGSRGGDNREEVARAQEEAAMITMDPAGNRGQGGLVEWFKDAWGGEPEVNVPLGGAVRKAVPIIIIDDDDPFVQRMLRADPREGSGALRMAHLGDGRGEVPGR